MVLRIRTVDKCKPLYHWEIWIATERDLPRAEVKQRGTVPSREIVDDEIGIPSSGITSHRWNAETDG